MLFRDATADDFLDIVPWLRRADAEEWRAASGRYPEELVSEGWRPAGLEGGERDPRAVIRVALQAEGFPLLLYGVNSSSPVPGYGWAWLIAAQEAPKHYREFRKSWDAEITDMVKRSGFQRWVTASWVGNPAHHKWLTAMGFQKLGPTHPLNGERFQPFIFTR